MKDIVKINVIEGTGKFNKKVLKRINSVNKKKNTIMNENGDKIYNLMIQSFNEKMTIFYNHVNLKGTIATPYMTVNSNTGIFIIHNVNLKVIAVINNIEISKKNNIRVSIKDYDNNVALYLEFTSNNKPLKEIEKLDYSTPSLKDCEDKIKKYKPSKFELDDVEGLIERDIKKYEEIENKIDNSIFLNIKGTIYNFKLGELVPYITLDKTVNRFYYKGRIFSRRSIGRGWSMIDTITYEPFRSIVDGDYTIELVQPITIEKVDEK